MNENKRFTRSQLNRQVGGVSAGIANYFNIDPLFVRLVFIALTVLGGHGIILYLVLWVFLPEADSSEDIDTSSNILRLYRSRTDRQISGVVGGIAEYFDVDASLLRIAFVLMSIIGGFGLTLYIALWLIMPEAPKYIQVDGEKPKRKNKTVTI